MGRSSCRLLDVSVGRYERMYCRTLDFEQFEKTFKESLPAERMLVLLDLLDNAGRICYAMSKHGLEVFYIEHCDCEGDVYGLIDVGSKSREARVDVLWSAHGVM